MNRETNKLQSFALFLMYLPTTHAHAANSESYTTHNWSKTKNYAIPVFRKHLQMYMLSSCE